MGKGGKEKKGGKGKKEEREGKNGRKERENGKKPDYFGGVLCNPLVQTSSQPSSRDPTEPTIITTTEIPAIEDVGFNDVTSDLNSCESVQVNLSQNGIVDIHNGYRADVS